MVGADEPTSAGPPKTSRRFCPKHVQEAANRRISDARGERLHTGSGRQRGYPHLQYDCRTGFLRRFRPAKSACPLSVPTYYAAERRLREIEAWGQGSYQAI